MWHLLVALCVFNGFSGTASLIIPNEIPTLLSVIYSNIPTIKKGTDSRLGWGFRLGDRADFQVLVELGPQTNTQPLGNQPQPNNSNKRNVPDTLRNVLYAQRQRDKEQISNTDGGKWIKMWSEEMRKPYGDNQESEGSLQPRPGLAIGEIDAKSVIPQDDDDETTSTEKALEIRTSTEKALDDVSLD